MSEQWTLDTRTLNNTEDNFLHHCPTHFFTKTSFCSLSQFKLSTFHKSNWFSNRSSYVTDLLYIKTPWGWWHWTVTASLNTVTLLHGHYHAVEIWIIVITNKQFSIHSLNSKNEVFIPIHTPVSFTIRCDWFDLLWCFTLIEWVCYFVFYQIKINLFVFS